jgi:hypothetical protein
MEVWYKASRRTERAGDYCTAAFVILLLEKKVN